MREGGRSNYLTDCFKRIQKIQERERAQVRVFSRLTDFRVQSVGFSCSIGVQNQSKRPGNKYNSSPLNKIFHA